MTQLNFFEKKKKKKKKKMKQKESKRKFHAFCFIKVSTDVRNNTQNTY